MVKKEYEMLKKKYNLPDFEALDNEFEISTLEKPDFLLRNIKKKICEKIELAADLLAKLIQPETSCIADLYEYRCFNDKGKKEIFALYSRVLYLHRQLIESDFLLDDHSDAAVITVISKEWPELRKQMLPFVKELGACWEKTPESDHAHREYLG